MRLAASYKLFLFTYLFMNIGYAELKVRGHYMGFRVKYKNDEASF